MLVVHCPACNAKLSARRTRADGTVDCPNCGQPLTLPTVVTAADTLATPPADAGDSTLTHGGAATVHEPGLGPVRVPGFEVIEEIGRGGMGVVYKARQLNPPRLVALKMVLAGEHADPDQLARFRTEAEATARLSHPAIVPIHHVGEWHPPSGGPAVPFLTLEYVDGRPLTDRLAATKPVAPRQAADFARRLARGVHYAHQQGVVHRDLKPSNVLVAGDETADSLGEPKVVDFGLAKSLDGFGTLAADGPQTQSGAVLGTPSYMAPEQAAGKKTIGPPADVYALGAILYELLTGRPPFRGESTVETLLAVAREEPEPPRRLRPKVPRDLETICLTCLAKAPEKRYPSAAALAKDLGRFLAGEPISVRPPAAGERFGRWVRRRREVVLLAGGAAFALVLVTAVLLARGWMDRPGQATAVKQGGPQPPAPVQPPSNLKESRRRIKSINNLKQLAIGLHSIHDNYSYLPPAAITDKAGKPLLSWRVAVLPYIEQQTLYQQFKLDEPWDGPTNKPLIEKMPPQFAVDGLDPAPPFTTHYQAVVGPGTVWEPQNQFAVPFGRRGIRLTDITDGTSNTLLLAEIVEPVIWTKPEDATFTPTSLPKFGGVIRGGFNAARVDGSVFTVRDTTPPDVLLAFLSRAGGETIFLDDDDLRGEPPPPKDPSQEDGRQIGTGRSSATPTGK